MSEPSDHPPVDQPQGDPVHLSELLGQEQDTAESAPREVHLDEETHSEVSEALGHGATKEEATPRVETPIGTAWQPETKNMQTLMEWIFNSAKFGTIEVTESEKSIYWKAMLSDDPMHFEITLFGMERVVVRVRNLNAYAQQVVAGALALDETDGLIRGGESMASAMQIYCIAIQAVTINTAPLPCMDFTTEQHASLQLGVEALRTRVREKYWKMNSMKLNLLIKAVTIFEIKQKVCNDAVANKEEKKGFWPPQGTA